jgi:hypothetical protein
MKYSIAYLIVLLLFGCAEKHKADKPTLQGIRVVGLDSISGDLPHDTGVYKRNVDLLSIEEGDDRSHPISAANKRAFDAAMKAAGDLDKKAKRHHWRKENFFGDNSNEDPFSGKGVWVNHDSAGYKNLISDGPLIGDYFISEDTLSIEKGNGMVKTSIRGIYYRIEPIDKWNQEHEIKGAGDEANIKVTQDSAGNYIITQIP